MANKPLPEHPAPKSPNDDPQPDHAPELPPARDPQVPPERARRTTPHEPGPEHPPRECDHDRAP